MDDLKHFNPRYFEQLGLPLMELELSTEGEERWSPEDERRRSEAARVLFESDLSLSPSPEGEGSKAPEWYEVYKQLRQLHFPWRVACYIAWASAPRVTRWPKTQDELATKVLGLNSDRVFTTWRRKHPEVDEAIALLQAAPLLEHRADVFKALAESAGTPDHRSNADRKLFLELTGDYVPRSKVEVRRGDADDLSQMSDDELAKLARLVNPLTPPSPSSERENSDGGENGE